MVFIIEILFNLHDQLIYWNQPSYVLHLFQSISYSNFLKKSKHLKFDQDYKENYKDL
jgi:hypothetical protein